MDAARAAVALDRQGVALATLPRLEQRVGEQGQGTGVVPHLVHEDVDQAVLDDQAGLFGRALDRLTQTGLVQRPDEVQPALHQPAEACVLRHLGEPVGPHGHEHRPSARLLD